MSFWWVSDAERSLSLPQFLELFVGGCCLAEGEGEAGVIHKAWSVNNCLLDSSLFSELLFRQL